MAGDWLRADRAELAVDRIIDAAGRAYAELGVQATSMNDIAARAGCSRATVYTYFPNRRALQQAFLNREVIGQARSLGAELAQIADPAERLAEAVLRSVAAVRATPSLAIWFEPADLAVATELTSSSEVVDAIVDAFTTDLAPGAIDDPRLAARWVVRTIISLLAMPPRDEVEEHQLIARCMVPGVLDMAPA